MGYKTSKIIRNISNDGQSTYFHLNIGRFLRCFQLAQLSWLSFRTKKGTKNSLGAHSEVKMGTSLVEHKKPPFFDSGNAKDAQTHDLRGS